MLQTAACHFVPSMQGTAKILKSESLRNLWGFGSEEENGHDEE
jgi:hypothetical protein